MTNSLLERLYGGLWGGAIGWAMETSDLGGELEADNPQIDPSVLDPSIVRVQQSLLWNEAVEVEGAWAKVLAIVLEAERRSSGDWILALPWAMNRSHNRAVTGFWLGTLIGVKGRSRAIPAALRVKYQTLGIESRSQAEQIMRSTRGIEATTLPILA